MRGSGILQFASSVDQASLRQLGFAISTKGYPKSAAYTVLEMLAQNRRTSPARIIFLISKSVGPGARKKIYPYSKEYISRVKS